MMNQAIKSVPFVAQSGPCCLRSIAFFHSTPVLEKSKRTQVNFGRGSHRAKRHNFHANRINRIDSRKNMLRNMTDFADYIFQGWRDEDDLYSSSKSNDDIEWLRKKYWSKGAKLYGFSCDESHWGKHKNKRNVGFGFYESDDDVESLFRSAFERESYSSWSFDTSESFQWRGHSNRANHTRTWDWRDECSWDWRDERSWDWRDEADEEKETDGSRQSDLVSERQTLGLKAYGPLELVEVKKAYRVCALRWHPDRHQGSSKAEAEEKFKHCSAAYKLLCDKLAA